MNQLSPSINVTSAFVNFGAALRAAGFDTAPLLGKARFINKNAESVYIHLTASGTVAPSVGTAGIPIGSTENSVEYTIDTLDANTTWLYSANAAIIKAVVQSAG